MCSYINSTSGLAYIRPPPLRERCINRDLQNYNMKSEALRRQTFEQWQVVFKDKNQLAAAGLYCTECSDVVC